jgi:hypothetical protein
MELKEFKKIVKWNDNLKGDSLRIAVTELGLGDDVDKYYTNINATKYDKQDDYTNKRANHHADLVGYVLKTLLPNAELFLLDSTKDESFEWIAENNIHLVNMSVSDTKASIYNASKRSFLATSAGNINMNGETMRDSKAKYWWQIGALDVDIQNEKFRLMSYSSWKYDKVDGATLSGINTPYGKFNGTSCSSPLYVAILAQYYQKHNDFFNAYPNLNQTIDFIDRHSHNVLLFDDDSDLKIGYGLLVLPENGESVSYNQVIKETDNGITTQEIEVPAEIVNGRTRLGLRDVSNLSGFYINWNNDKRQVELYKQQGDH